MANRLPVLDPSQLPPPQFLEVIDSESILAARMAKLKEIWAANDPPAAALYDVETTEFDPIKIQEELNTFFETTVRDRVNQAGRSVMLAFAIGSDLEGIASNYPGGMPKLEGESDERYRRRIWLSPNALSPHGNDGAYELWALNALDGALRDATARKIRPTLEDDPLILITALATPEGWDDKADDATKLALIQASDPRPSNAQLVDIRKYIADEDRQGLTDMLRVAAPKVLNDDYYVKLWTYPAASKSTIQSTATLNLTKLVVDQYWLGQDHAHMAIDGAVNLPGVHHAQIVKPTTDLFVDLDWIVKINSITVEIAGTAS